MNSIRPLVTITILVVVGAFLYVKINQGPVHTVPPSSDAWPGQSPEGVPPLAVSGGAAAPSDSPAPPWSANTPSAAATSSTAATPDVGATASVSAQEPAPVPAVPPIPDLPDLAAPSDAMSATATATVPLPSELPSDIPTARYPDQSGDDVTPPANIAAIAAGATGAAPPAAEPAAPPTATVQQPLTPEEANELDVAAADLTTPPLAGQENPLRQSPPPAGSDRYGAGGDPTLPAEVQAPALAQASFATSWPEIQAVLDRGELARAHELLTQWYDDPTLTPTDAELVDTLLSQLAGTVVYSTRHELEPPYVVKPGDTLETIAKQYSVPWQLLAKINGIPAADQVQPGQELKVVRGPFSAVVDLGRKQLTLMVDDRYAGKFPVAVPSAAAVSEGRWIVDKKLAAPAAAEVQSAYAPEPDSVDRAIVLRGEPSGSEPEGAATLMVTSSGATRITAADGLPAIHVSPQDAEELSDILSVGSRVVIRR